MTKLINDGAARLAAERAKMVCTPGADPARAERSWACASGWRRWSPAPIRT